MSWDARFGVGGFLILLLATARFVVPFLLRRWRDVSEGDEAEQQRRRGRELTDQTLEDLKVDRAKYVERMAERAEKHPQDKVKLFDAEHRPLGSGLHVGEDPLGRPVIWVPPAVHGLATSAEGASGPIANARFDDGGIEGPWDAEIRDDGRWKLPSESGWRCRPSEASKVTGPTGRDRRVVSRYRGPRVRRVHACTASPRATCRRRSWDRGRRDPSGSRSGCRSPRSR